jgi:hypothetical protein
MVGQVFQTGIARHGVDVVQRRGLELLDGIGLGGIAGHNLRCVVVCEIVVD